MREDSYEEVILRVLKMALKDYSSKRFMANKENKQEILLFFKSQNFNIMLDMFDMSPDEFFIRFKKKYRKEVTL